MKYRHIIASVLLLSMCFSFSALASENVSSLNYMNTKTLCEYSETEMPETTSGSIAVYNKESGLVVYEKNPDTAVSPTSTVKVMTAIVAYENIPDLSVDITITRKVVNESTGTKLGLKIGDVYKAEDLLKAVLICGSNDAANQIAEYVSGGDKNAFISMMNSKAAELGCTDTFFTNVTGLHDSNMHTTAGDMLKIAVYAYNIDDIVNWSSLSSYSFAPVNNPDHYILKYNRNNFISRSTISKYYYKNSKGLSSGGTPQAGNCLITSASKNEATYICVIMDSPISDKNDTNYAYVDAKSILDACFSSFQFTSVLDTDSIIYEVPLKLSADSDHVSLYPKESFTFLLPASISMYDDIKYEKVVKNDNYSAPIVQGSEFGELIIKYKDDYILGRTKLVCKESFKRSSMLYIVDLLKKFFKSTFFIVTLVSAIILFGLYTYISIKNRNRFFSRRR